MNTTYKQQIAALQTLLHTCPQEQFGVINDAANTIYAKMLEDALPADRQTALLTSTAIKHLEERVKGAPVKTSDTLQVLYKLKAAINKEERPTRRENIWYVTLCALAFLGMIQLLELLILLF